MARLEKFSKEIIMNKMVEYIRLNGIQSFNVRDVAKYIGCSTQPLFRLYSNTDELKKDLKKYLHDDYDNFIAQYINKEDYIFTISYIIYKPRNSNLSNSFIIRVITIKSIFRSHIINIFEYII